MNKTQRQGYNIEKKFSLLERQAYLMGKVDILKQQIKQEGTTLATILKQMDKKGYGKQS